VFLHDIVEEEGTEIVGFVDFVDVDDLGGCNEKEKHCEEEIYCTRYFEDYAINTKQVLLQQHYNYKQRS
jgi:hypothetical protein